MFGILLANIRNTIRPLHLSERGNPASLNFLRCLLALALINFFPGPDVGSCSWILDLGVAALE